MRAVPLALKSGGWQEKSRGGWEARGRTNTPRAATEAQAKFQVTMATKRFCFTACDADLMGFVMGAMCRFKCTSAVQMDVNTALLPGFGWFIGIFLPDF